jgi:hypothetical protein
MKKQAQFVSINAKKKADKQVLAYIGANNLIGVEDISSGKEFYTCSARCISQKS